MKSDISDNVTLLIPAKSEYVSTVRLTASSVANRVGFNIDEIEDIKVAVAEVCNMILSKIGNEINQYKITFCINSDKLVITFTGEGTDLGCFNSNVENEYGIYIMRALMDSVELCNNNSIVMVKKIGE